MCIRDRIGTDIFMNAAIVPAARLSMDIAREKKITSFQVRSWLSSASASRGSL